MYSRAEYDEHEARSFSELDNAYIPGEGNVCHLERAKRIFIFDVLTGGDSHYQPFQWATKVVGEVVFGITYARPTDLPVPEGYLAIHEPYTSDQFSQWMLDAVARYEAEHPELPDRVKEWRHVLEAKPKGYGEPAAQATHTKPVV